MERKTSYIFYVAELSHLHRRFGHPQVDKRVNILKRAEIEDVDAETRRMIERMERSFGPCQ